MLGRSFTYKNGDTLIEVLFAIAVFSLVAVCSLSIMNQGSATAQRSLEITLVRQQIDSQVETLHFLNESYTAAYQSGMSYGDFDSNKPAGQWAEMMERINSNTTVSDFGLDNGKCPTPDPSKSFILNTRRATFVEPSNGLIKQATTFAQVRYDSSDNIDRPEGIWIEAIHKTFGSNNIQKNAAYVDFHIRACWDDPGHVMPMTLGTIVRLYEPKG
ncbi:MAG: hypothetical protein PHO93_00175 [Candidatus Saccharimonadaceae bacterium]|nr:hypothetical protein [Candidatus Saccharimonadaceae bacterium]